MWVSHLVKYSQITLRDDRDIVLVLQCTAGCLYMLATYIWMTTDHSIEAMSVQWVHNVAHVHDWTRLYCCNNTAARLSRRMWLAGGRYVGHSVPGRGWYESRLRRQRHVSQVTAIVPRSTNRCKQSRDWFELANGRCLNEFRYSYWVYTENENEIRSDSSYRPIYIEHNQQSSTRRSDATESVWSRAQAGLTRFDL